MSDFEQMVQYWDNTGEWRKSYYTQLKNITSDKLYMAEKMERELDLAEYTAIDKIIKYKKKISLLDIGCGVGRQILDFGIVYKQSQFEGAKNEILNSTTTFGGGIYSRTVKVYSFI